MTKAKPYTFLLKMGHTALGGFATSSFNPYSPTLPEFVEGIFLSDIKEEMTRRIVFRQGKNNQYFSLVLGDTPSIRFSPFITGMEFIGHNMGLRHHRLVLSSTYHSLRS